MSLNKIAELAREPREEPVCLRLSEIADMVGGELVGTQNPWITGVSGIREAEEGDLTFLSKGRYRAALKHSRATAVLVGHSEKVERPALRVDDPAVAFMIVVRRFAAAVRLTHPPTIHPTAILEDSVRLGRDVSIGAHVVIEGHVEIADRTTILPGTVILRNSRIGSECMIYPNVTIRESTEIGDRVILHAGAVIGSDGFGFVSDGAAVHKVPHIGRVVLEDDVEVGANTCIDRATTGTTRVRRGTKIDNLVQIAHNVKIGEYSILCGQAGISGSTEIGNRVKIAGQAGTVGHIEIGDGATIGAKSGVSKSIPSGTTVSGFPAQHHARELRERAAVSRLPRFLQVVRELRRRVEELERKQERST
ncbi:MAG: UDP-3-O-(3-hydroxymyristoyl)glucosamine N-acyltransferase [Candidatus Krumholzibacteriia bacterium]